MQQSHAGSVRGTITEEGTELEGQCHYQATGYWWAGHYWSIVQTAIGLPTVVLAAVSGVSALSTFPHHQIVAGVLAITVAVLTAVSTFLGPGEQHTVAIESGKNFSELASRTRIFTKITAPRTEDESQLVATLESLRAEYNELVRAAPHLPLWAHRKASRGLVDFDDKEVAKLAKQAAQRRQVGVEAKNEPARIEAGAKSEERQ